MKTKQLILSVWILLPILLTAQVDKSFLKDYKYPDIKRQTLDVGTGFFAKTAQSVETMGSNPSEKVNNNHISISGSAKYTLFINNRKWQRTADVGVDGDFDRMKAKESLQTDVVDRSMDFGLKFNSDNRLYSLKESFLEFNVNGSVKMKWDKQETGPISTSIVNDKRENINIDLGVGKGRLEYISDATMALFILRDFKKLGILEKEMTAEDERALADLIAEVRYQRFFDGRHKIIYQLTQLDSLLQQRGIIDDGDAASFTTLYDHWFYGFSNFRYSGSRISFGLRGTGRFSQVKSEGFMFSIDHTSQTLIPGVYINYQLQIPINLFFQHSLYINTTGGIEKSKTSQNSVVRDEFFVLGDLGYQFSYYPNTRTSVSASLNVNGRFKNRESVQKSSNFSERLELQTYYYLSPHARLGAYVNFQFFQTDLEFSSTNPNNFNNETHSISTGINFSYAIF